MTNYDDLRTRMQHAHVWHMHRETWEDVVKKARPVMDEARAAIIALQTDIKHLISGIEEKSDDLKDIRDELTCEQERVQELEAQLEGFREAEAELTAQLAKVTTETYDLRRAIGLVSAARLDGVKAGLEAAASWCDYYCERHLAEKIRDIDPKSVKDKS